MGIILKKIAVFAGGAILVAAAANGLGKDLTVVPYTVHSQKITAPVRIVVISDLHSCRYGEGQEELVEAIRSAGPDLIVYTGDIADDVLALNGTVELLTRLDGAYPAYYAAGNHEFRRNDVEEIKDLFRRYHVTVLSGEEAELTVNGQTLTICGIDDPWSGRTARSQLEKIRIRGKEETGGYRILLAHRPEQIDTYLEYNFDLILSGHAHGGQWRIPGLINGVYAPDQGIFPKYAGGRYDHGDTVHIVSRGLEKDKVKVPRIFNPPELVVIDICE